MFILGLGENLVVGLEVEFGLYKNNIYMERYFVGYFV